jgi:hypothetical protein
MRCSQTPRDSRFARRDIAIERSRRDAEAVRDLAEADIGIGQQRLGGLDVVIGKFRRSRSRSENERRGDGGTNAPRVPTIDDLVILVPPSSLPVVFAQAFRQGISGS